MANIKITGLTAASAAAGDNTFEIAETPGGTPAAKKVTLAQMFALNDGARTASAPILNLAQTFNNGAVAFTALKLNITDTASDAASLLLDLQVGGTSQAKITKAGALTLTGPITATRSLPTTGTITASAPAVDATQTWNNVAVTFTGLKLNVTDTTSAAGSLLLDLQVGASSKASITKAGNLTLAGTLTATQSLPTTGTITADAPALSATQTWNNGAVTFTAIKLTVTDTASAAASLLLDLRVGAGSIFNISKGGNLSLVSDTGSLIIGASGDLIHTRDAANVSAQRNGVNAQTMRVYNTFTDAANYERATMSWNITSNVFTFGTNKAGTGSSRALQFIIGGTSILQLDTSGHMLWNTDNTLDIGATGATRPRSGYFGTNVTSPLFTATTGTITTSQPALNATQTWNAGAVTFTGILANITNTASAAASKLIDLQLASTSVFNVTRGGALSLLNDTASITLGSSSDLIITREAANILAQRNSTTAQTFRVYNTYTDASNYERGVFDWSTTAASLTIGTQKAGTGSSRQLDFMTGSVVRFSVAASGNIIFGTDNANDIGNISTSRPRSGYFATQLNAPLLNAISGTITASAPGLNLTQTWNSGGVTFNGLLVNITDTASAAASLLLDLQVGASSKASISKAGAVIALSYKSGAPAGGAGAGVWKLGTLVTAAITPDATRYVELDIAGTLYKLVVGT